MCNAVVSQRVWDKLLEVKRQYEKKHYILDSVMTMGNYGTGYILHKNCRKYYHIVTIQYNINYSVDDILVSLEKSFMGASKERKKIFIKIDKNKVKI